jgi:hypothetical protein
MAMTGRLRTLVRTVARLRPQQIAWRAVHVARRQAYERVRPLGRWLVQPDAGARVAGLPVLEVPTDDPSVMALWRQGQVSYLGVAAARLEWSGEGQSKLWRYCRQYHAELPVLASTSVDDARMLVDDWLLHNPPCRGEAWEPYPVARRILNWSLASAVAPSLRQHLAPWLAAQMRYLDRHLERHLLGNHLLCDLCALVAAAAVLDTPDAPAVAARAGRRLERELACQVLPDGGYAERTVQYHAQVMSDALLAMVLARARGRELGIAPVVARMARWLATVRRPDGSYPWLNDAAPDGMPVPALQQALVRIAGIDLDEKPPAPVVELPDTGWTIVREGSHELLFEHGVVGPRHQPGHGHADALAFELIWNGMPVICDTGVTTYAAGETRGFERSAAAHATVTVDGHGADEVWASFRVGGRSRPVYLGKSSPWPGAWLLRGLLTSYRGFVHQRGLLFWPGRALVVVDQVQRAPAGATIQATLPLAPAWYAPVTATGCRLESKQANLKLAILAGALGEATRGEYPTRPGWVGHGFGKGEGRLSLRLTADAQSRLVYAIVAPTAVVTRADDTLTIATEEGHQSLSVASLLR